jgi:hypothetical protein
MGEILYFLYKIRIIITVNEDFYETMVDYNIINNGLSFESG